MVGAVWTQLTKIDVVVNEEKEEIFEATIFFQAHTFLSDPSPIIALGNKSNGSYVIKDFGTLPLIFSTSKYFRWKFQS